jgi:hypothetical protein
VVAAILLYGAVRPVDRHGAELRRYTIASNATGRDLKQVLVVPSGGVASVSGLVVILHREGDGVDTALTSELFAALSRLGPRAPAVLFPSGDDSWWHDRGRTRWGAYVTDEAIPVALKRLGRRPLPVAIGGMSMGGFGALDLARRQPGRFCATGAHGPALSSGYAESAEGAFDDEGDFEGHDVVGFSVTQPLTFAGQPLWVDVGQRDRYRATTDQMVGALRRNRVPVETHVWRGVGHGAGDAKRHWGPYLRFYARALAACGRPWR